MKAYKVFIRDSDGRLLSAGDMPKSFRFVYNEVETNVPKIKGSKFFVFSNYSDALCFANRLGLTIKQRCGEIWEVKIPELIKARTQYPNIWIWEEEESIDKLQLFWNGESLSSLSLGSVTDSVFNADSIKLIKKL